MTTTQTDKSMAALANVLRQAHIRVTAVGHHLIELECTQREAELAREIACQMSTPVIELHETWHLPTDYPRTWEITFSKTDGIYRPQSGHGNAGRVAGRRLPNAQDQQSPGIQDNPGRDGKPE